jgi:tRNA A-37 threonylcarbamoyl transferase component Bud32
MDDNSMPFGASLSEAPGPGEVPEVEEEAEEPPAPEPVALGPNPLKELMTAKKINLDKVREMLVAQPDVIAYFDIPLELGPPLIERPVVHAVAKIEAGLLGLLIEFKAEFRKPYQGKSMYNGWIKPGLTLIECVNNRKCRFVGTMLGEKLEKIEEILHNASEEQDDEDADVAAANSDGKEEAQDEAEINTSGVRKSRPSVAVRKTMTKMSSHTQAHPKTKYEIREHLNDGANKSVCLCCHKKMCKAYAMKLASKSDEMCLWEEILLMQKLKHPNVIALVETFETEQQVFVVLEYCSGGHLFDQFAGAVLPSVATSQRLHRQLGQVVAHMHNLQICHRSIHLDNILLVDAQQSLDDATLKLIDYSVAKSFAEGDMATKVCIPVYVAREILSKNKKPYTEKIDVWSLGVVFFIMLCGRQPFNGDTDFEVLKKVKKGVFAFEPANVWSTVPDAAKDVVQKMICSKVEDRLSASGVTEHPWLKC